jgi:LmbE family N-acetylglucosaminyl deacetylase
MTTRTTTLLSLSLSLAALSVTLPSFAEEVTLDAARLAHAIDRLSNTARVLYVAAHPDDENTRLLAYLANARHASAQYLSMTRGGGGQNLIGREQDALLDVLRSHELLAARSLDGATQRFSRARDFGYSKSAAETLSIWGHDEVLSDVVYALRSFRPDVVITRFNELPPNHGHHTASAILAREAFSAAADPKRFPEQLKLGVTPWQAKRLVHNYPTWQEHAPPPEALPLDVGAYDARLGLSYGELAARSRSQHKSQGFGAAPERGRLLENFVHLAGQPARADILDDLSATWAARYPGAAGAAVDAALAQARSALHRDFPERASPPLAAARRALAALPDDDPRVKQARHETERLALLASGVFVRASAKLPGCVPDGTLPVHLEIVLRRPAPIKLRRIRFPDGQTQTLPTPLAQHDKRELDLGVRCPADAQPSSPYWLREPYLAGRQVIADQRVLDDAVGPAPLVAAAEFEIDGEPLTLDVPLTYVYTDRVQGERDRPVAVLPPLTITPEREAIMFPGGAARNVQLRVQASADAQSGKVSIELPSGYRAQPEVREVQLAHAGDETVVEFKVTPPPDALTRAPEKARLFVEVAGRRWGLRQDAIDYPHVPAQLVLQQASLTLSPVTLTKPEGRIGYVDGSGDTIASDLVHVGATVETLNDRELMQGDLSRFSAIVLGVRSFNTRDVLRAAHPRLMRYVQNGGTLVVQYVTRSNISPLEQPIGPYPLDVGRGRVTDEHAQITLAAGESLLQRPHRIGPKDFEGWVQERGLYFGEKWDPQYKSLLEMADPNEPVERGALLVARHGRGRYVYTGLSFFRQLPAGVPGAYRLFLNLLAAPSGEPAKPPQSAEHAKAP